MHAATAVERVNYNYTNILGTSNQYVYGTGILLNSSVDSLIYLSSVDKFNINIVHFPMRNHAVIDNDYNMI